MTRLGGVAGRARRTGTAASGTFGRSRVVRNGRRHLLRGWRPGRPHNGKKPTQHPRIDAGPKRRGRIGRGGQRHCMTTRGRETTTTVNKPQGEEKQPTKKPRESTIPEGRVFSQASILVAKSTTGRGEAMVGGQQGPHSTCENARRSRVLCKICPVRGGA